MKKSIKKLSILMLIFGTILNINLSAQSSPKPIVGVLGIDIKGFTIDSNQAGSLTRTELSKLAQFEVMDDYDVEYLLSKNEIEAGDCFGKLCLLDIGRSIKTDKMLTGKIELIGEQINITYRLIDVGTETIEKTFVAEYLNLRPQLQSMIRMTLRQMFELEVDQNLLDKLTKQDDYKSAVNTDAPRLNLNGPRMGAVFFTGEANNILKSPTSEGGFDLYPLMFQFGYQWEVQYINQGDFQALFEFIPMITGLDQGKFIPSISVLNGMRSSRTGWEFAFGPNFFTSTKAKGYNYNGKWILENELPVDIAEDDIPTLESRTDSRGNFTVETRFVFAVGKTFKSGKLNIPVNAFFIPHKSGHRMGISVGYNVSR